MRSGISTIVGSIQTLFIIDSPLRIITTLIILNSLGRRSIYFFKCKWEEVRVKELFLDYVKNNTLKQEGPKTNAGFLVDAVKKQPIVRQYDSRIEVLYGIEIAKEITRLNGQKEIHHIGRVNEISFDEKKHLIGVYTPREGFAQYTFESLKKNFADPNSIEISRITYDSDFIHWLANNARVHSTILKGMKKVKAEKDDETGIIWHEDEIHSATLYETIDSWTKFEFVEGSARMKGRAPSETWATIRIYNVGKLTITHPDPYEIARIVNDELGKLYQIYGSSRTVRK